MITRMAIKHTKICTIPDQTNAEVIRPSDWNAEHELKEYEGTALTLGAIADTQYLKRSGTEIIGVAASAAAIDVSNTPAGGIAATNAQAALNELDTEKVAKAGDAMTGALSIVSPDAANVTAFSVTQQDTSTAIAATIINAGYGAGLFIDQNGNGRAIDIDAEGQSATSIYIQSDMLSTGSIIKALSGSTSTSTRDLVLVQNNNAAAINTKVLNLKNESSGDTVFIDQNGNGVPLHIDNDGTANSLVIEGTTPTDLVLSKAGNLSVAGTITTGTGAVIPSAPTGGNKKVTNIYFNVTTGEITYEVEP
jgi:hypothetical protein